MGILLLQVFSRLRTRVVKYGVLFFFILCSWPTAHGQILNDAPTQQIILQSLDNIYNYEFVEAVELAKKVKAKYPNHPVNTLLQATQLYWQYLPLGDSPKMKQAYTNALAECIKQGEALKGKYDLEANFFLLAAHSYLAMQDSDEGSFMKALGEAKRAYTYMKRGFELTEKNPEFYFSTGLYNYYVEQYPEDHPIVKPFMIFFQDGDKPRGLQQLDIGFRKAIFTRTESAYYLIYIYLKAENKPDKALNYTSQLYQKYPNNPLYLTRHAEALTLMGRYEDAEPLVQRLVKLSGKIFPVAGEIFEGIIQEKQYKNDKQAAALYQHALKMPADERFTEDYHAFAYCGIARIAHRAGDKAKAKEYYKKALSIAEYKFTIAEAKAYLK